MTGRSRFVSLMNKDIDRRTAAADWHRFGG
jgi:hypothetical protein